MAIHPTKSILGNNLPDDARYTIHRFMTQADMAAYTLAMGRFGQQLPIFTTPQGIVRGLSVEMIQTQTGQLSQEYKTVKVGSGHKVYVLPKHQPETIPFAQRFELLRKAAASYKTDRINAAFEGLKTCKNLTPAEKRDLLEFVLRSQPLLIPNDQIVAYLAETNAFEAATPRQMEGLLSLACAQAEGRYPSNLLLNALIGHLKRVDDRAVSGFDSVHPEFLAEILKRLAGNRESLSGYRALAAELPDRIFTAPVVSELLSRLSMNMHRSPDDFADLAPFFENEELRTELNGFSDRELRTLAVRAIDSKNPDLVRAFCRAVASQDLFPIVKQQFEIGLDLHSPEYRTVLQQAVALNGQFGAA